MNTYRKQSPAILSKVRQLEKYMANHKGYIAGGCFKNIFTGTRLKDIDVFFKSEADFSEANAFFKNNEMYVFSYENQNTIAYKNKETNIRVELIRTHFLPADDMLNMFDFSITKMAYYREIEGDEEKFMVMHHENFFQDLVCKKLVLEPVIYFPVSTFERAFRYGKYGYGLCKESKENLINSLKTNNDTISESLYFGLD